MSRGSASSRIARVVPSRADHDAVLVHHDVPWVVELGGLERRLLNHARGAILTALFPGGTPFFTGDGLFRLHLATLTLSIAVRHASILRDRTLVPGLRARDRPGRDPPPWRRLGARATGRAFASSGSLTTGETAGTPDGQYQGPDGEERRGSQWQQAP
jgi:hypothetical protein